MSMYVHICECVSGGVCMQWFTCGGQRTTLHTAHTTWFKIWSPFSFLGPLYTRLAGTGASGHSPVSTSHLGIGALGLQSHHLHHVDTGDSNLSPGVYTAGALPCNLAPQPQYTSFQINLLIYLPSFLTFSHLGPL